MELLNFRNNVAKSILIIGIISLVAAVILFFISIFDVTNFIFLYPTAGCLVNGFLMFGFAYVVEACAIYVEKNWEGENTDKEELE